MNRKRMAHFIIRSSFQVETPGLATRPVTAPPLFKNLFCAFVTIEVAVVDESQIITNWPCRLWIASPVLANPLWLIDDAAV